MYSLGSHLSTAESEGIRDSLVLSQNNGSPLLILAEAWSFVSSVGVTVVLGCARSTCSDDAASLLGYVNKGVSRW